MVDAETIEGLCLLARKQFAINKFCKIDDYGDADFNEVSSSSINENLVFALSHVPF